jgi:hypothetical protein
MSVATEVEPFAIELDAPPICAAEDAPRLVKASGSSGFVGLAGVEQPDGSGLPSCHPI